MKLFKRRGILLVIVTAIIVAVIAFSARSQGMNDFFSAGGKNILSPFQSFFNMVGNGVSGLGSGFGDKAALQKENDELKAQVSKLKGQIIEYNRYKNENLSLRSALKLKDTFDKYNSIGGNIIAKEPGNWFNTFTIDVGSSDKVKVDSPVISAEGALVGRVAKVSGSTAVVVSVIDPWSKVSAVNSRTGELVICVRGDINLSEQGLCRLEYVDQDIEVGDILETTGITGIYPKGLVIGTVTEIRQSENEMSSYAVVQPEVNFQKIREGFVLIPKK